MFNVITDYPIAFDSPDHTSLIFENGEWVQEGGTRLDCSTNSIFNERLYQLFPTKPLFITDWGCAGGCFIEECILDGHIGVGLEGSDYSLKRKRESWGRLPNNFFTCDISRPFQITYNNQPCLFDVITSWECLEHLTKDGIVQLWENIKNHLKPYGIFIGSIATMHESNHHQIKEYRPWWENSWRQQGLKDNPHIIEYFRNQFIRGPEQRAPGSFLVALTKE